MDVLPYKLNLEEISHKLKIMDEFNLILHGNAVEFLKEIDEINNLLKTRAELVFSNKILNNIISAPSDLGQKVQNIYKYNADPVCIDKKNTILLGDERVGLSKYKKLLLYNNLNCKHDLNQNPIISAYLRDTLLVVKDYLLGEYLKEVYSNDLPSYIKFNFNTYDSYREELKVLNSALNYFNGNDLSSKAKFAFESWQARQIWIELKNNTGVKYSKGLLTVNPVVSFDSKFTTSFSLFDKSISNTGNYLHSNTIYPLILIKDFTIDFQVYDELCENILYAQMEILNI